MRIGAIGVTPFAGYRQNTVRHNPQFGFQNPPGISLGYPLLDAIVENNVATFKKEINSETLNVRSVTGRNTPLHVAIIYARPEMVRHILRQKDLNLEIVNAYKEKPLDTARRQVANNKKPRTVHDSPEKQQRYKEILTMVEAAYAGIRPVPAPEPPPASSPPPASELPAPPPEKESPCSQEVQKTPWQEIWSGIRRLFSVN